MNCKYSEGGRDTYFALCVFLTTGSTWEVQI